MDGCPGKKRLFKENLVSSSFRFYAVQSDLFALGADLAVIHSPSSLFEIAEQAPQFEDLMICCMTGKQSPQESKKLHASKGPVLTSARAFWVEECPSPVRIKKALAHTTRPRNLNFASYRLTSAFGDVPRRFQTTVQT